LNGGLTVNMPLYLVQEDYTTITLVNEGGNTINYTFTPKQTTTSDTWSYATDRQRLLLDDSFSRNGIYTGKNMYEGRDENCESECIQKTNYVYGRHAGETWYQDNSKLGTNDWQRIIKISSDGSNGFNIFS